MTDIDLDLEPASESMEAVLTPTPSVPVTRSLEQLQRLLERQYPRLLKERLGEIVTLQTGKQLINLWRTLFVNLQAACVQPIVQETGTSKVFKTSIKTYY